MRESSYSSHRYLSRAARYDVLRGVICLTLASSGSCSSIHSLLGRIEDQSTRALPSTLRPTKCGGWVKNALVDMPPFSLPWSSLLVFVGRQKRLAALMLSLMRKMRVRERVEAGPDDPRSISWEPSVCDLLGSRLTDELLDGEP